MDFVAAPFVQGGGDGVIARIGAGGENPLDPLVIAWVNDLQNVLKRSKHTSYQYGLTVRNAMKGQGWTDLADLTPEQFERYLAENAAGWKAGTQNRNVCALRSFSKYLIRIKAIAEDPFGFAPRAPEEQALGKRASTTDEAVRILKAAYFREHTDRRSKSARTLYWMFLYVQGCRSREPEGIQWKHLDLDDGLLCWHPQMHKNRTRMDCPLAPELWEILLLRFAALCPTPEEFVFRPVPPATIFRADRQRAGIKATDARGRGFSPHSTRKWYETELVNSGVPQRMVDYLMRHKVDVPMRYFDPKGAELRGAVAKLPAIWPITVTGGRVDNPALIEPQPKRVDGGGDLSEDGGASLAHEHHNAQRTRDPMDPRGWHSDSGEGSRFPRALMPQPGPPSKGRVRSTSIIDPTIAVIRSITRRDRTLGLLERWTRLLEGAVDDLTPPDLDRLERLLEPEKPDSPAA